jgi:disulfide bond formation protein DsbB
MRGMTRLSPLLSGWRWPVFALAASALMLAAAHAFEQFGNLAPCPLCLRQREVYWALIAMTLTGLGIWRLVPKRRFLVALNVLIGLVFVTGVVVAAYHAGVEWQIFPPPTGCSRPSPRSAQHRPRPSWWATASRKAVPCGLLASPISRRKSCKGCGLRTP